MMAIEQFPFECGKMLSHIALSNESATEPIDGGEAVLVERLEGQFGT
jgi:hypothetical protein